MNSSSSLTMRLGWILPVLTTLLLAGATCLPAPNTGDSPDTNGQTTPDGDELALSVGTPAITVVEYGDFQCPFCGQFARETFPTIRERYIDTGQVRWVFRHFPLTTRHPQAWKSAEASQCAFNQGQFWAYHDLLFTHQSALQIDDLKTYATQLGLDRDQFDECLDSGGEATQVQDDQNLGIAAGVTGTPTFVVGGQNYRGFQTVEQMSAIIDAALQDAP